MESWRRFLEHADECKLGLTTAPENGVWMRGLADAIRFRGRLRGTSSPACFQSRCVHDQLSSKPRRRRKIRMPR
jgi:hypothetical protein